ncbi:hypothetical protein THAOC_14301, partial [Thalassiosira oceanica]
MHQQIKVSLAASTLKRRSVKVPQDERHRQLRHRQEERPKERQRHHQVEVHEEVAPELRESLYDRGAHHASSGVSPQRPRHVPRVGHLRQLLDEAVPVLGRLAPPLSQVGHHGVRGVAAQGHGPLGPGAEEPLGVERRQQRRAVVQVPPLDVVLAARFDQLEGEGVPDVAVVVPVARRGELPPEPGELRVGILRRRLGVDPAGRLADEREPLLPLAAAVRAHEVLLLPQEY